MKLKELLFFHDFDKAKFRPYLKPSTVLKLRFFISINPSYENRNPVVSDQECPKAISRTDLVNLLFPLVFTEGIVSVFSSLTVAADFIHR
jgi:hypothetical protein